MSKELAFDGKGIAPQGGATTGGISDETYELAQARICLAGVYCDAGGTLGDHRTRMIYRLKRAAGTVA